MKKLLAIGASIGAAVTIFGISIALKKTGKIKKNSPEKNDLKKDVEEDTNVFHKNYEFETSNKHSSNYFIVVCKAGHVGQNHFTKISYPIYAENGKAAAKIARNLPRVKHDQPDAIISCTKVSKEEFRAQKEANKSNPFLHCTNRQMQRHLEAGLEIFEETKEEVKRTKKHSLRKTQNFLPKEVEFLRGNIKNIEIA